MDFFNHFRIPNAKGFFRFCIDGLDLTHTEFRKEPLASFPAERDCWFGPAMYKSTGLDKKDVLGSMALWCDIDDSDVIPRPILPPNAIVRSGHGWHCYWFLGEPAMTAELIEHLNKCALAGIADVVVTDDPADHCWNANRVLRVPGTTNNKAAPVKVELKIFLPNHKYSHGDVTGAAALDAEVIDLIRSGSIKGFKSKSERDWRVICDMVRCGITKSTALRIFQHHPIGDKLDTEGDNKYFNHSYERAIDAVGGTKKVGAKKKKMDPMSISAKDDGFYKGDRRISTFVFDPQLLLDATSFESEDAIVGTVRANDYEWKDVTFTRRAFTHMQQMDKECPVAAWQWTGYEQDLRALLPYLMDRLRDKGLPRVAATPTMGLHFVKGVPYFVGDHETVSADEYWDGYTGPIAWLPSKREHAKLNLKVEQPTDEQVEWLSNVLPRFNDDSVTWLMTGWFAASPLKPWLEKMGRRFPAMNVTGTRGSGKSTIIQRVYMPLFGHVEPKSYDAGTTRFVTLTLLGSANAVPVSFSEYRGSDSVEGFLRYIRLAYDTGHDPRGTSAQQTIDYPLSAPILVDGEDLIVDPACQERIVVAQLKPSATAEGAGAYEMFTRHGGELPTNLAGFYLQQAMKRMQDGRAKELLQRAKDDVFGEFTNSMPDRVRNNHIVATFGMRMWCDVFGLTVPRTEVLKRSLGNVCNLGSGKSRTSADYFVEYIVDEVARAKTTQFKWVMNGNTKLYVQITSAHNWWTSRRRSQGKTALEVDAIRNQIVESPYYAGTQEVDGITMYGIDLALASRSGLDVTTKINAMEFVVSL